MLDLTLPEDLENTPYSSLVVGSAIFKYTPHKTRAHGRRQLDKMIASLDPPEILLVKRTCRRSSYPDYWELPSKKMDEYLDPTIYHALGRGLEKTTGLWFRGSTNVLAALPALVYEEEGDQPSRHTGQRGKDWMFEGRKRMTRHRNFAVKVDVFTEDVDPDPQEHSQSLWVNTSDLDDLKMTEQMKGVVVAALKFAEENPDRV